jgi:urocanate hydratase
MYRLRPSYPVKAYPYQYYPTRCVEAACIIHNIMNNLDPEVAQFP